MGSLALEVGLSLLCCLLLDLLPLAGLPCLALVGEDALSPGSDLMARSGWYPIGASFFSEKKGSGNQERKWGHSNWDVK